MNRRETLLALGLLAALIKPPVACAQDTKRRFRVGYLSPSGSSTDIQQALQSPPFKTFVDELRVRGYVLGSNLDLDIAPAYGRPETYAEVAAALVSRKPDVIVVVGSQFSVAASKATSSIPIVMNSAADPVKYGLVASLARPRTNVTGLSADVSAEVEAKRLSFLLELLPKLNKVSCVATKWIWDGPYGEALRRAEKVLRIRIDYVEHRPADLPATFQSILSQQPRALFVVFGPDVYPQRAKFLEFVQANNLPAAFPLPEIGDEGGLLSYGLSLHEQQRSAARYVAKILQGANPGELAVEQPSRFELVINLKTAKTLGIAVPQSLLLRADRVIE